VGGGQSRRFGLRFPPSQDTLPGQAGARPAAGDENLHRRLTMSVAKISEISSTSNKSFEDAIEKGIARASKTLRNVRSAWIKEQQVRVENGKPTAFQVNMMVTFVLDDE
jgi:dodecin